MKGRLPLSGAACLRVFLTRCNAGGKNRLWRRIICGNSTANYYFEMIVLKEAAVANGSCVASLVAIVFAGGNQLRRCYCHY